ncbi:MAG TPA: L,D-transpeptidase family protein [Hanamia sp.]|nr:L,D-transpeptidase family protein [Hanamia sp.]
MKKIILLLIIPSLIVFSCDHERSEKKEEKKISKRHYEITKANSYNDIFLDSMEVVNYIDKYKIPDSVARRIISFYNTRNYEYAWFSSDGLSEQAMGFSSLLNFTGDTSKDLKKLQSRMDKLLADTDLSVSGNDKNIINTEINLTERLIDYSLTQFPDGYVKRKELERFIPFKKQDPIKLADSLLNKKHKDDKYFSDINPPYKLLSEQLKKYVAIVKSGGWPAIGNIDLKKFKMNDSSADILAVKRKLILTGDLQPNDTSSVYDTALENAIKNYQQRFGFTPDGKLGSKTLEQLRTPAIERVKQILINMNRMRWLPTQPQGRLIVVNIPAFTLHVIEDGKTVFTMPVVVGKDGHNTTLFSDLMTTIVFSPYWNVPPSIVKKEILPGMQKDPDYLEKNNMEIYGGTDSMPEIRQKPGPENSLGKVKFLFPNVFNIYLHDTPAKWLFNKDQRAYSHGCIRLGNAEKMADYLLKDDSKWTPEKIQEAMNSGDQQFVTLKDPVPVFITYYTAWVDENGQLNFRDDIYGHDQQVAEKMFVR